ncbi:MAG: DUF378 domain-containing protein [Firmicutes bacterium]|nr:DUF378 domain-containing protein [Bacillota bacterium]
MDKAAVLRWVKFISFGILLFGGLNWLIIGLFEFDIIAGIFGGMESVASRIFYSLFGLAAVVLLTIVLVKVFSKNEGQATKKVA